MSAPIELPPPPPLRPRGIGDLLEMAIDLYRANLVTLVQIAAIVVIPVSLIQYFVTDVLLADDVVRRAGGVAEVSGAASRTLASSGVIGIVSLLVYQVLVGAITWATASALVGRTTSVRESYRFGYARLWSLLLVSILVALAVIGGFILLVVPGLIVLTRLSCAVPALVVEGHRGRAALTRSWNLVRDHGWRVFGAIMITGFLVGAVNGLFTVLFRSGWFVRGLAAGIGSAITTPFATLMIVLIYFDLRVRKEQLDLARLARELHPMRPD